MKMSEEIYVNTGVTAYNTTQAEENIYDNELKLETRWKGNKQDSTNSGHNTVWSRCFKLTAVCVLMLCVLLLTAVTVLWIKYYILNTQNNQLQTSYNNLSIERDQLQTGYNNVILKLAGHRWSGTTKDTQREDISQKQRRTRDGPRSRTSPHYRRSLRSPPGTASPPPPPRKTDCDNVIIGDSNVRQVRATVAKGKARTHCLPGARVLDVSAQVPRVVSRNTRAVVLHVGSESPGR
ncbi:uncharacterized protein LOC113660584 [Tachysurus fulvidraco]|uniref:uncharacterized protein LOC113660584 n=1 Tax=Tachysurus fulvidraco TaxID=1234273 RepID=UPI001FED652E|nr:uncharacterized protein LOC113660584 [Tachysurus fulvidraco]